MDHGSHGDQERNSSMLWRPARLLCDFSYPSGPMGTTAEVSLDIDNAVAAAMNEFCRRHDVGSLTVLLCGLRTAHYRLTGAEAVAILFSVPEETNAETTFLRVAQNRVQENQSFRSVLKDLQEALTRAPRYDSLSESVGTVTPASIWWNPTSSLQVFFGSKGALRVEDKSSQMSRGQAMDFHLCCSFSATAEHPTGSIRYAKDLFHEKTVLSLISVLNESLRRAMEDPDINVGTIQLLPDSETSDVLMQHHPRSEYPKDSTLVDLFNVQAATHPSGLAVKDPETELTYSELHLQAMQVATWLVRRELTPGSMVIVFGQRSCRTIITFLGILMANLAYVPVDYKAPSGRIISIMDGIKTATCVIVTEPNAERPFPVADVECVHLNEILNQTKGDNARDDAGYIQGVAHPTPASLAYVMFTSGSTGRPKGVMTSHRNVVRLIMQRTVTSHVKPGTRIAHVANMAFDGSTWEIYTALLNGGTVVCFDVLTTLDMDLLAEEFGRQIIRLAKFTPALLQQILNDRPDLLDQLDLMLIIGDRLDPRNAIELLNRTKGKVFNAYGPTESTGHTTCHLLHANDDYTNGVPVGKPIANSGVFVMDSAQKLVPDGVIGELVVVGEGVGMGYLHPKANGDPFTDILMKQNFVRAYRTGDYGRRRPRDGVLEFMGRRDHQVKIRGHRVELREVETAILETNLVCETVVVHFKGTDDSDRLIAFASPLRRDQGGRAVENSRSDDPDERMKFSMLLRDHLNTQLPSHMMPSFIMVSQELPRNVNRKIDRQALLDQYLQLDKAKRENTTPGYITHPVKSTLHDEFRCILGTDVGDAQSFFSLGGHSLMATRLMSKLNKRFSTALTVKDLFEAPNINLLAERVHQSMGSEPYVPIPNSKHEGSTTQSSAQRRMWFMEQLFPHSTRYLMPYALRIRGNICYSALRSAFDALGERHEVLRTIFDQEIDDETQIILPQDQHQILIIVDAQSSDIDKILKEEQHKPFDLTSEPGWRVKLYRLDDDHHVLSIVMHHIVSDDWSMDILRRELKSLYAAALDDKDCPSSGLSPLSIQYRDFSIWERSDEQQKLQGSQMQYWMHELDNSQPAQIPSDQTRPEVPSGESDKIDVEIDGAAFAQIQDFCRLHQVTPYVVLLGAFRAAHYRLTKMQDATIGSVSANRNREELEGLIGCFVNLICIRTSVQQVSFIDLVRQVQKKVSMALQHQNVPFERLVAALSKRSEWDPSRNPLVQMTFTVHPQSDGGSFALRGTAIEQLDLPRAMKFDLEFHLYQKRDKLQGNVRFAKELYTQATVEKVLSEFFEVLQQGMRDPKALVF